MAELKIYDEISKEQIFDPDLEKGYLYDGQIKTGTEPEKRVIMEGTITERNPEGLKKIVPAKDIYEPCKYYHTYTEEELNPVPTDYATWTELAAAYKKGVELA